MHNKNSSKITPIFLFSLAIVLIIPVCSSQCCLAFSGGACVSCLEGMHLFRGNCLYDLAGCASYVGGFDCGGCRGNYELVNGSCWHARFPAGLANATNFTVYLQSALQSDASMAAAQDALKNSTELWVDWYSATLREEQTYLNSRSLAKTASEFMRNVSSTSKIHYIFTGRVQGSKESILLYRFVYELSSGGGFADCLVGVEMLEERDNYIELMEVKLKRVEEGSGWMQVKAGAADEVYILGRLTIYFPKITGYGFLKGFRRDVDEGVNYTMFFMSNDQGILSFVYLADKGELPAPQTVNTINTSPTTTTTAIDPPPTPVTPTKSPQPSYQNTPSSPKQIKKANNSQTTPNQPTPDTTTPPPSPPKDSSMPQMTLNSTNVNSNPIFAAGYAVIMQQYGLSPACLVQQLFSIASSPTAYGFYLEDPQAKAYYRFAFTIDLDKGIFQIVNYTQRSQPLITITPIPEPIADNKKNSKKSGDKPIGPSPINPSTRQNSTSPSNSSSSTIPIFQFCGKGGVEYIDITNKQTSDLFLPKINLLLHAMYETMLANTHIKSVKYMLALDPSASTSSITYQISYVNAEGTAFNFEVAIVNNEFQLVSYPNTAKTDSPTPTPTPQPILSGSDKTIDANATTLVNSSTEGKSQEPQNASESPKLEGDNKNKTDEGAKSKVENESAPIKPSTPQPTNKAPLPQNHSNADISKKTPDAPTPTTPPPISPQPPLPSPTAPLPTNPQSPLPTNPQSPRPSPTNNVTTSKTASDETSIPLIISIPAKNFTTQPRYKSLINILRSIYRIPANATVVSMEMWNDTAAGDSKYQITFKMGYALRWGDGNVAKVSSYNLFVNPSSFVSVHSEKIEYIKEKPSEVDATKQKEATKDLTPPPQQQPSTLPSTPPPPPPSPPSNSSVLFSSSSPSPPSIALLGTTPSPYLKNLYQIFTRHSPSLGGYSLQSLNWKASNASGAITSYTQRLQFSKQGRILCFLVRYESASLKNGPPASNNDTIINIVEYRAIGCGNSSSPSPLSANFTDEAKFNLAINAQLQGIARNQPVTFSLYQRAQSYYLIRFQAASFGQREVLIDSGSLLVLRYLTSSKPVYSFLNRTGSVISSSIADALRASMQKIFRLGGGSLLLEWMGKSNDDEVMLLQVLGRSQVQSSWARPVYQHFAMRAVYWPSENYIKIVGATALGLFSNQYAFNLSNPDNWTLILPTSAFTDPSFAPLLPSLASSYTGFLQNTQIVAVYRESSAKNITLSEYLSSQTGARLLVGISKRFSANREAQYLLTVRYYPTNNQTHIENIESVGLNSLLLNGCQDSLQGGSLPQCRSCMKGYRLGDGFCSAEIEGCLQYGETYCLRCRAGLLISKDLRRCLSAKAEEGVLLDVMGVYNSIGQ